MKLTSELFDYQRVGVEKLRHVKVGALYMEPGTGKTRTALELVDIRLRAGKVSQVLWLCPFSVQRDLPELLSEHAEDFESVIRIAGIESLSQSEKLVADLLAYVSAAPTFLIVDESLLVKNPYAYRTQNVTRIASCCRYKLILNGTPISRCEADLFAQWYVLDWRILGYPSYWSFAANHVEMDPQRPGRIERVINVDHLTRKVAPYTYEIPKSVLNLPEKAYRIETFKLTDEQAALYEQVANRLLASADKRKPTTLYRLFGAMQAIASGFHVDIVDGHVQLRPMYPPEKNPRIAALRRILRRMDGEQVVIFCRYTQEIHDICQMLGDAATPFYGEMSQKARQQSKTRFKSGDARFFVANKACGKFGLNLQFCRNGIFYGHDWDWATREQAEDRLHRSGQLLPVRIYDVIAQDTIDVTIQESLTRKENLAAAFTRSVRFHTTDPQRVLLAAILGQTKEVFP